MERLIRGVHAYREGDFAANRELLARLARGQDPDTLFITCSDSRISPTALTQAGPGELFVLRNAGNLVPAAGVPGGEAATVEYAVRVLHVRDIVVCGHTHCGAISSLLGPEPLDELPAVQAWLEHAGETRAIVDERYPDFEPADRLAAAVRENVLVQLDHLRTHPCVRRALDEGAVRLHGWVFDFEHGHVYAYDPAEQRFRRLTVGA